ncbi:hypothetical protein WJX79_009174 [Trebouxia sp. C0005]
MSGRRIPEKRCNLEAIGGTVGRAKITLPDAADGWSVFLCLDLGNPSSPRILFLTREVSQISKTLFGAASP